MLTDLIICMYYLRPSQRLNIFSSKIKLLWGWGKMFWREIFFHSNWEILNCSEPVTKSADSCPLPVIIWTYSYLNLLNISFLSTFCTAWLSPWYMQCFVLLQIVIIWKHCALYKFDSVANCLLMILSCGKYIVANIIQKWPLYLFLNLSSR